MNIENNNLNSEETEINIQDIIEKYIAHWKWFAIGIFVSLFSVFFILRYTTPKYEVSSSILVKDDKKGGLLSELSTFQDLGGLGGQKSGDNMDNTIEILKFNLK